MNSSMTHEMVAAWESRTFNIKVNRDTIGRNLKQISNIATDNPTSDKKRLKTVKFLQLDEALHERFLRYQEKTIINDSLIKEKAKQFATELEIGDEAFTASNGWLQSFKSRH